MLQQVFESLAMSPLFSMAMDGLKNEVMQKYQWTKMFSDDIVIRSESRSHVKKKTLRGGGMHWQKEG